MMGQGTGHDIDRQCPVSTLGSDILVGAAIPNYAALVFMLNIFSLGQAKICPFTDNSQGRSLLMELLPIFCQSSIAE